MKFIGNSAIAAPRITVPVPRNFWSWRSIHEPTEATASVKPASKAGRTENRMRGTESQSQTDSRDAPATPITMPATRNQFSVSHGWMWSRQMTDAGRGGLGGAMAGVGVGEAVAGGVGWDAVAGERSAGVGVRSFVAVAVAG